MEENKVATGGNCLEEGQSFDSASIVIEDSKSPDRFGVRGLQPTTLEKLLDAMPMPARLIDLLSRIAFANRSCRRISREPDKLPGLSLLYTIS